jgi:hypothetical protein
MDLSIRVLFRIKMKVMFGDGLSAGIEIFITFEKKGLLKISTKQTAK